MAKNIVKPITPASEDSIILFNFPLRSKYIFLAILAFVFYVNSIFNKYAFDDLQVIETNSYVQMGFSGIPKILTSDLYSSYYTNMHGDPSAGLSGGRYRPLSEIVFALEQQLMGGSVLLPYLSHLVNVLAYVACVLAIFYFLEKILLKKTRMGIDISFLSAFLFAIHPIHTEVVANIKSLDEILSLLFIMLTFIFSLNFIQNRQTKHLVSGMVFFLCALLSKEYAITLLFFIPFLFYLLAGKNPALAIKASIPYIGVIIIYLLLRYHAVGFHHSSIQNDSPLSNPYYYATSAQKAATECFILGKYLWLLLLPYPLVCDYSYNQIPYHNFSDITTLASICIYGGLFIWGLFLIRKTNVLSFAVFFFLLNILIVSNFAIDIGATMGERLAFHSSLGFVIIAAWYLVKAVSKMTLTAKKKVLIGFLSIVGMLCFGETIVRNAQWKDYPTLFIHDVGVSPNSLLLNINAARSYMEFTTQENDTGKINACLDSARNYYLHALQIVPDNEGVYFNLGDIYARMGQPDRAKSCFDKLEKINPDYPELKSSYTMLSGLYLQNGIESGRKGNLKMSVYYMKKALSVDSTNAHAWYNLGIAYFHLQQYDSVKYDWIKTLQCNPDITEQTNAREHLFDLQSKSK